MVSLNFFNLSLNFAIRSSWSEPVSSQCCFCWLKLKKMGKTTRPFRYDLNQIPYDYTVKVRNRFKGLDLIDKECLWTMDGGSWHCTGDRDQDHPQEKEMQKSKMAVWWGLTNSCETKISKKQRRKGKISSWEICMQVRKQQLELDMEKQTGSK